MTHNNPFARLGSLDQQLYQETSSKQKGIESKQPSEKQPEENKEKSSLLANQQPSKLAKKQTSKEANSQTNTLVNQQRSTAPLSTKKKKKYGTYLREDSILAIQVHAIQTKIKDHEVLQEAVDLYFWKRNR